MLIKVKMPTIVCILTFMSRINFVLSSVEHVKSFITLEPCLEVIKVVSCLTEYKITTSHRNKMLKKKILFLLLNCLIMYLTRS